ncbi:hypothetical protein KCU79_g20591, partial [Aureobasidium melanogenum]
AAFRDEFLQSQGHQTPQTNGALNFHTGHTPTTHQAPSTPTTSHAAISGGVFGNFQYAK